MAKLLRISMHDGSRHFGDLPESQSPLRVCDHVSRLPGARLTGFLNGIIEFWIDFTYEGHEFTLNTQYGDYWFFVTDPDCPDQILQGVLDHFARILR